MTKLEKIAYQCQRFHIFYWATQEAAQEGRPYSDRLYKPVYHFPPFTRKELDEQARQITKQNQYLRMTGQFI